MKMENCNQEILTSTMISYGQSKYIGIYALASIANELWMNGAEEIKVEVSAIIPPLVYKSRLNGMLKILRKICEEERIYLEKANGQIVSAVSLPLVCVTGVAKTSECLLDKKGSGGFWSGDYFDWLVRNEWDASSGRRKRNGT